MQKLFSCFIDLVVSYTWTKAKDGNLPKDYFGYFPPNSYDSIQFCRVNDNANVRFMHFSVFKISAQLFNVFTIYISNVHNTILLKKLTETNIYWHYFKW